MLVILGRVGSSRRSGDKKRGRGEEGFVGRGDKDNPDVIWRYFCFVYIGRLHLNTDDWLCKE